MRTIYFTIGFSSIKLYLTPTEAILGDPGPDCGGEGKSTG